jgi:hypothetical protein
MCRGAEQVPLSNIKRLFRSQYQLDLSETALGHTRLSDLLQDSRFADICSVQLQDRGYAVFPAFTNNVQPGTVMDGIEFSADSIPDHMARPSRQPNDTKPTPQTFDVTIEACGQGKKDVASPPDMDLPWKVVSPSTMSGSGGGLLQRAVIQPASAPPTPPHSAPLKALSPLSNIESFGHEIQEVDDFINDDYWSNASETEDNEEDDQVTNMPQQARKFCEDQPLSIEETEVMPGTPMRSPPAYPVVTPSPTPQYAGMGGVGSSLMRLWAPVDLAKRVPLGLDVQGLQPNYHHTRFTEEQRLQQHFCADEPLCLDEAGSPAGELWMSPPACTAWTPSPQYRCRSSMGLAAQSQPLRGANAVPVAGTAAGSTAAGARIVRIAGLV